MQLSESESKIQELCHAVEKKDQMISRADDDLNMLQGRCSSLEECILSLDAEIAKLKERNVELRGEIVNLHGQSSQCFVSCYPIIAFL